MSFDLHKVHQFQRVPGTQSEKLVKTSPAMRLSAGGQEVYVQEGRYWTAGGDPVKAKDLPEWVAGELKKASPAALSECGINIKVEEVKPNGNA